MRKFINLFTFITLFLVSCDNQDNGPEFPTEEKEISLTTESTQLVSIDNQFGIDIFKRMLAEEDQVNVMISPLSISQALLMTYNGANGETKSAFEKTLYLSGLTREEINQSQKELVDALLEVDPGVIISIANSIWCRQGFSVKPDFIQLNQDYFNAEVAELVFDQTALDRINNWVSDNTNGKIEEIIDKIDPNAVMFLINAIYFKGNWKYTFDESNTISNDFYLSDGNSVSVLFMQQEVTARMMFHNNFEILELPYGRGNYSMLIFLPHEDKTIEDILNVWNAESYNDWLANLEEINVDVRIPKFKFGYEKFLDDYLKAMGLSVAYDPMKADFSNMTDLGAYIDFVKHKSFIEVNEKGTEAAAVTVVAMELNSAGGGSSYLFTANRPFLFAIREKYTNSILFMGKVENPLEE